MAKWNLDPSHSEVQFKVKHMVISTVTGNFDNFSADLEDNTDDFAEAKFEFDAQIDSINTKNKDRDTHLKSADFFAAEQYPVLKFESTSGIKNGKIDGILEIHGEKKPVTLNADFEQILAYFLLRKHIFYSLLLVEPLNQIVVDFFLFLLLLQNQ